MLFLFVKKKDENNHIFYSQINKYQNIQYNMKVGKILFLNVDGFFSLMQEKFRPVSSF